MSALEDEEWNVDCQTLKRIEVSVVRVCELLADD